MKRILSFVMILVVLFVVGCKKEAVTEDLVTNQSFDLKSVEDVSEIKGLFQVETEVSRNWFDGLASFFGVEGTSPNVEFDLSRVSPPTADFSTATPPPSSDASDSGSAVGDAVTSGESSQTNVQVKGVDEADIIKNDNRYVYIINGLKISVIDSADDSVYVIDLVDKFYPSEAYLKDNLLVVMGYLYERKTYQPYYYYDEPMIEPAIDSDTANEDVEYYYYATSSTVVSVIDVSDKTNMEILRTVTYEDSNLVSSRMVGNSLYLVLNQNVRITDGDVSLPGYMDTEKEGKVEAPLSSIYIMRGYRGYHSYNIISSLDVTTNEEINYEVYLGYFRNIYASTSNLYVVNQVNTIEYSDQVFRIPELVFDSRYGATFSNIYRFNIEEGKLTYKAKTTIAGNIKDQFSMDEYQGIFRVASTVQTYEPLEVAPTSDGVPTIAIFPSWMNSFRTESFVHTFDVSDNKFERLDTLGGIGIDENIYSVRFDKTLGYVVTFRQIDPLYKIDFSDPTNIVILGELKSPGVSDYLHIHSADYIVGIGRNSISTTSGTLNGVKVSLFKVSGEELEEVDVYLFEGNYSNTSVQYNHLSLITLESQSLYIFPITIYNANYSGKTYIAVIEINEETEEISLRGLISKQDNSSYYYDCPRAVVVNSKLYSIFNSEVVINALDDSLTLIGTITLEVLNFYNVYDYVGSIGEPILID